MINYYDLASNNIENIKKLLIKDTKLNKEEILKLSESIKELQKSVKEKTKNISIKLSKSIINRTREHCALLNQNTEEWIESTILKELENFNSSAIIIDNFYNKEQQMEELVKKYSKKDKKKFIKTEDYLLKKGAKFVGHSVIDGRPVYEHKDIGSIKGEKAESFEISKKISSSEERKVSFDDPEPIL